MLEVNPDFDFNEDLPDDLTFDNRFWFDWSGMKHTESSKQLIRESKLGVLNPQYGKELKDSHPFKKGFNKGLKFSQEHKRKMKDAKLGKAKTQDHKRAMSLSHKMLMEEKVLCPYCNKYYSKNHWATKKYHFDNCKKK